MGKARSILSGAWRNSFPALALIFVAALSTPLAAQQLDPNAGGGAGGGGIVTERLEPLESAAGSEGDDGTGRDSRFKPAPFRTLGIPQEPELIVPVETAARAGARMRLLDKMTGRTQTFETAAGAEAMIDRLRVRLDACRSPEDNAQHGTMAFLQIWDTKRAEDARVFSGWMFSESPALSAMDHPRYDVWVISCTTSAGDAPVASE